MKTIIFAVVLCGFFGCSNKTEKQSSMDIIPVKTVPHVQNNETAMEVIPVKTVPKNVEE